MMKKIFVLLLTLAMTAPLAAFAGCEGKETDGTGQSSYYMVNAFDTTDDVLLAANYFNWFDSVEQNTDPAYITEGTGSLKLNVASTVLTGRPKTQRPTVGIFTSQKNNPQLYAQMTNERFAEIDRYTVDIYNGEDDVQAVEFWMSEAEPGWSKEVGGLVEFSLQPGWNYLSIPVPREALSYAMELNKIETFFFTFSIPEPGEVRTFYIDNFRAYRAESPLDPNWQKQRKADELFAFDDETDAWMMERRYSAPDTQPSVSLNTDRRFIRGGSGSLKMTIYPVPINGLTGATDSPAFGFLDDRALEGARDMSAYSAITYSFFNDSDQDLVIHCYFSDDKLMADIAVTLKQRAWTDVETTKEQLVAAGLDITNLRALHFAYNGNQYLEPMTVYMDEFMFKR